MERDQNNGLGLRMGGIIFIDEADVFLEERTAFDVECSAIFAIFLRQIEQVHSSSAL